LGQSQKGLERLASGLRPALPGSKGAPQEALAALAAAVESAQENFVTAMDDDFNGSGALASMFDLVRVINQTRTTGATNEELSAAQDKVRELSGVLGLMLASEEAGTSKADGFIDLLVELRSSLRQDKQWAYSDRIRDELQALGVVLEDSKDGTTWRWGS
jgi:cysteinyl-tRNA synthetase